MKIQVPAAGLSASWKAVALKMKERISVLGSAELDELHVARIAVEAFCEHLAQNPIVPTLAQTMEVADLVQKKLGGMVVGYADFVEEWQRRMFLAPDGPSETALHIGARMQGVTLTEKDADYLINQVILATTPGYEPPGRR